MSINLSLFGLSKPLTRALLANPDVATEINIPPDRDEALAKFGFAIERTVSERPDEVLRLNKDWHLMHTAYSNAEPAAAWPTSFLVAGGQSIAHDNGYGPTRLLNGKELGEVDTFLEELDIEASIASLTEDELKASDVYVYGGPHGPPVAESHEIVRAVHKHISNFTRRCVTANLACLMVLS